MGHPTGQHTIVGLPEFVRLGDVTPLHQVSTSDEVGSMMFRSSDDIERARHPTLDPEAHGGAIRQRWMR